MSIAAKHLSHFYGGVQALNNVCLHVNTGEHIGIIGESGGGKSTLLKLLSGLYAVQKGSLEVHGEKTPECIRMQCAMVMQSPQLFPASIRDNITCGHPMDEAAICDAAAAAQLSDWIASLPDGLDTFVGERGGRVSGGQAQRIAIARAIAKAAPVLLLDEAFSALDPSTGSAVLEALMQRTVDKTVISVSHQREALVHCSRLYRLEGGRLLDA